MLKFKLDDVFVEAYRNKTPDFGFNGLGAITYYRTYSRLKEDGTKEDWWETVRRVVEGCYSIQKDHIEHNELGWNEKKAQRSAQEMYDRMFEMKFLPPGRMLWAMGTHIVHDRKIGQALFNCAFVGTGNISRTLEESVKPFCFMMDMSMTGVGVGFDVKGEHKIVIHKPSTETETYQIPDDREGWVESLKRLLLSYFGTHFGVTKRAVIFDYSVIRKAGEPIHGFGGLSSGPDPLETMHKQIRTILDEFDGKPISITNIVDIMNLIGQCVVAGNVRRTAQIALGPTENAEYGSLKDYRWNNDKFEYEGAMAHRAAYGWTSNNSVVATVHSDLDSAIEQTKVNGEPGYIFMDNMRAYSRMSDPADNKDSKAVGTNPCGEQTLESYELCCVSGDTKILTSTGYRDIIDCVKQNVRVWNGQDWSSVEPFVAATGKKLYRVTLSDGSHIDVTDNHRWSVKSPTGRVFKEYETIDLEVGMDVESFEIQSTPDSGQDIGDIAYAWGFFAGDGYLDKQNIMVSAHGRKATETKEYFQRIGAKFYKDQHPEGYSEKFNRLNLTSVLQDISLAVELNDREAGIPDKFFGMSTESIYQFVAGWIDTDGNMVEQINTDNYRVFGTESKMRDLQLLLRQIGINHATIYKMAEAGELITIANRETTRNYSMWVCYIPSYECEAIAQYCLVKKAARFGDRMRTNNAYPNGSKIDYARKQKIESITILDGEHTVYCFDEPVNHKGVFGNCLTHQCLVESFPSRAVSYEDYRRTLKFAYLLGKTATLINTTWSETNRVQKRNRRIGTSVSGVTNFLETHSVDELRTWLVDGYQEIERWDREYSAWLCVPQSIKKSSVKPSGTVSLLAGVNPGCHFPEYEYYIRRIRLAHDSPMVDVFKKAGYEVERDVVDKFSAVISFPIHNKSKNLSQVSIWEQVSLAVFLQKYWSDNQVSSTVTFNKDEANQIKPILDYFRYDLKSISFLPRLDKLAYAQMPYEAITEEKYLEMSAAIDPVTKWSVVGGVDADAEAEKFCNTDSCIIT